MSVALKISKYQCVHCGTTTLHPVWNSQHSQAFCCLGCRTVYQLIHEKGLSEYYQLKKPFQNSEPVTIEKNNFSYLDDLHFQKEYVFFVEDNIQRMTFYLEGMHCVACIWLIEKVCGFIPSVERVQINLENSTVDVYVENNGKFSQVAYELSSLGYKVIPLKSDEDSKKLIDKEEKSLLIKTGVAFGLTGNIMLMSLALYGGATEEWKRNFELIAVLLSIPLVFYCANPFYQNIWGLLKRKELSLDLPIALAIWGAFYFSVMSLIDGEGRIYADSMGMLISFLLLSRFILFKVQKKTLSSSRFSDLFKYQTIKKMIPLGWQDVLASSLKVDDIVLIEPSMNIPVDGIILEGESYINQSLLTGESIPVKKSIGDEIKAGAVNNQNQLRVKVVKSLKDSSLGTILKKLESHHENAPISRFADSFAKYFLYGVLSLALFVVIYFYLQGQIAEGISRAIAIIIVSCPCVFGMSIPLTMSLSLRKLAKLGIIVKNDSTLEKLSKVKKIIWDKTGTLTEGKLTLIKIDDELASNFGVILELEKFSEHPIALAIREYAEVHHLESNVVLKEIKEQPGLGVSGYWGKNFYELKSARNDEGDYKIVVGLYQDGNLLGKLSFHDGLRKDAKKTIEELARFDHMILSGDSAQNVAIISEQLGIKQYQAEVDPEAKAEYVKRSPLSMILGDGANDAMAMQESFVSVAVKGSVEYSLKVAHVYLTKQGIEQIKHLFTVAQDSLKLIKRNLIFSVIYNVIGISLSIFGFMTPLWAAILMPMSSLTILFSTLYSTKKMREI